MRVLVAALLMVLSAAVVGPVGAQGTQAPNVCVGTLEEQPDTSTVVSIQGTRVVPDRGAIKKPALLVSYSPNGSVEWVQNASANGRWWAYDVDPLENGNLLFVTTESRHTDVGEFDPDEGEYVWLEHFRGHPDSEINPLVVDAHDADLHGEELVLVDKGQGHERLLAYNLTTDQVAWEWRFENHTDTFPESGGGPPDDWTHVNDVDRVGEDRYMISVRNFDQVAFVNRTTDEVELALGSDNNYETLFEQHNPDHLWGPDGEHTVLVADSLNDRVVEYEYDAASDEWDRVWSVTGLNAPRDADRLENGNTLVTDRKGHRVLEVTPEGRTVWEVYTPFEPYDSERNEPASNGPTMREQGVTGEFDVSNDADFDTAEIERCGDALFALAAVDGSLLSGDPFTENASLPAREDSEVNVSDESEGDETVFAGPGSGLVPAVVAVLVLLAGLAVGYRRYR